MVSSGQEFLLHKREVPKEIMGTNWPTELKVSSSIIGVIEGTGARRGDTNLLSLSPTFPLRLTSSRNSCRHEISQKPLGRSCLPSLRFLAPSSPPLAPLQAGVVPHNPGALKGKPAQPSPLEVPSQVPRRSLAGRTGRPCFRLPASSRPGARPSTWGYELAGSTRPVLPLQGKKQRLT